MTRRTDHLSVEGPVHPSADAVACERPLGHRAVALDETGWLGHWQVLNVDATLPHVLDRLEMGEARANLARLTGEANVPFRGMYFTDSDIYKTLEALAWSAGRGGVTDALLARGQALVDLLAKVQDEDGYLNSYVQGEPSIERWSDPQWGHELYTAGHLFQAAVAAARVGVFVDLVDMARRFADLLVKTHAGADSHYIDGHPQVETALVELYRLTDQGRYLELAAAQLDRRGHGWLGPDRFGSPYFQDHQPLREAREATGHAVRQLYLLAGMVDVAVEQHDEGLLAAAERIWADLSRTKTHVSGAHGSRHRDEAIGDAYELPPDRAYAETCAAIASFQLSWRLLLATGDVRYADEMETCLFNAIAVSTSRSGTEFFYSNPLQIRSGHDGSQEDAPSRRLPWFACACCPPNIARLIASVHDYLATTSERALTLHHYASGRIETTVGDARVGIEITTRYPHQGAIRLRVQATGAPMLRLRIPSWCTHFRLTIDGLLEDVQVHRGYLELTRDWTRPTEVELVLDMPARTVHPHVRIDALRGTVALARGPLLFALEQADLPADLVVEDARLLCTGEIKDLPPNEPSPIAVSVTLTRAEPSPDAPLYGANPLPVPEEQSFVTEMLPYHSWGNRDLGAMRVWLPVSASWSGA